MLIPAALRAWVEWITKPSGLKDTHQKWAARQSVGRPSFVYKGYNAPKCS